MEASEGLFQQRLNENQRDWEEQLKYVNQQSKEGIQKLHSTIHNEQEILQNSLSKLSNRLDGLELTVAQYRLHAVLQTKPLMLTQLSNKHKPK